MRFGTDGHILCFRFDGTIISFPDRQFIGRSISDLKGGNQQPYGDVMLQTGLEGSGGGHIHYAREDKGSGLNGQRLGYIRPYPDWQWILVADMSMDDMEKAIRDETHTYTNISFKNVFIFIALFGVAVLVLLGLAYYHSLKIKQGIHLFTDFFRKAADTKVKIRESDLIFTEFEDLGRLANGMVEDRIQKEHILRRDELRLDTLLQLSMMQEFDIPDKYDFVLHRIIQITGSDSGYVALINEVQSHTTLCSLATIGSGQLGLGPDDDAFPRSLVESGMIGHCVQTKNRYLQNNQEERYQYPYAHQVGRRLDVPVLQDNRVVLVAGVCNSGKQYDSGDARQMTMLLEGLWLHIQKICADAEMAKLERQVIAISEEERSKIGRDLHDDLGSHLSGVELLSKVLQQKLEKQVPNEAKQLAEIRNLIRESIEKTRRLSRGLYPVHVIDHGLEAALEELLAEIEQLFPIRCSLSYDTRAELLGSHQAPHVYYIIREALFNAARHAKPQRIAIVIRRTNQRLTVTISDDGQGILEKDKKKGMGLHTMHYRAKAIGAELDIRPDEQGGTIVTLTGDVFS
jgi:signal transduction histidine kinase